MIHFIFGLIVGLLIGALGMYAFMKGLLKDVGVK